MIMVHKVKRVTPLDNYELSIQFVSGETKIYDVKPLFEWKDIFNKLKENELFNAVYVDLDGNGIAWNDEIDLSCDELWENGVDKENH